MNPVTVERDDLRHGTVFEYPVAHQKNATSMVRFDSRVGSFAPAPNRSRAHPRAWRPTSRRARSAEAGSRLPSESVDLWKRPPRIPHIWHGNEAWHDHPTTS